MQGPPPSKVPPLAPQPKDSLFLPREAANNNGISNLQHQSNSSGGGGSSGGITRKANIRDTSEDEDAALANSSLCRLLQGPDPRWETVTAEVDATAQEDAPVAPPPPPPSFFELPSDVLVVSSGGSGSEVRRARYDSCPMALRQPLSVPTPSQVSVASVPPSQLVVPAVTTPVVAKGSVGGRVVVGSGANGGNCCRGSSSSAPPSAVNAVDVSNSSREFTRLKQLTLMHSTWWYLSDSLCVHTAADTTWQGFGRLFCQQFARSTLRFHSTCSITPPAHNSVVCV